MVKENLTTLFDKDSLSDYSHVFEIPLGGEATFVALGLKDDDYVHFELVYAPGLRPNDMCECPPVKVMPPAVIRRELLQFNGVPVILKADNPVAVISAPQGFPMRAVRHIAREEDRMDFVMLVRSTQTRKLNTEVMSLIPMEVDMAVDNADGRMEGESDGE